VSAFLPVPPFPLLVIDLILLLSLFLVTSLVLSYIPDRLFFGDELSPLVCLSPSTLFCLFSFPFTFLHW
jgi:hypothetical protein